MTRKSVLATLATAVLGVGLIVSPASAKCTRDCKHQIKSDFQACKGRCKSLGLTGDLKKACRQSCKNTRTDQRTTCNAATNPTPPGCSPSGAFVD